MPNRDTLNQRDFLNRLASALLSVAYLDKSAAFAATRPALCWAAVQRLLEGYVADKKIAGAATALSYSGSPLADAIEADLKLKRTDGPVNMPG
jgi:hypothetical protein